MPDYYGYGPVLTLERPLAVFGLPGSESGVVSRVVSMLGGLRLCWLDRQVSHVLGVSVEWADVHGNPRMRLDTEADLLDKALRGRPGVIACSDVTLGDPVLRRRLTSTCELVRLDLSLDMSLERVRVAAAADPRNHYALLDGEPFLADRVLARLAALNAVYDTVPARRHPVGDALPLQIGQDIVAQLELRAA